MLASAAQGSQRSRRRPWWPERAVERTPPQALDAHVTASALDSAVPRRIWSGTALQVAGRLWSAACTLAYFWLAAHTLPLEHFGRLTFYLAIFAWLDSLANMGTGEVAVQWTAAHAERTAGVLTTARRVRITAGLCGVVLVGVSAFASGEPGAGWILLASLYPVTHALELSATVFKNRIAWGVPVIARSVASGLSLAGVALLAWREVREPALYLVAVAAGSTMGNVILHVASRRFLAVDRPAHGEVQAAPLGPFLRAAIPLGISGLCAQTYFYVDNLFVRAWHGDAELGRYNLAVRVLSAMIMLAQYSSLTALPWFTRRHKAGDLGAAVARLAGPISALAGLGAGLAWPLAPELLGLFGEGFESAASALRWLLLATLAIYAGSLLLTAVVATGATRSMFWIAAAGLAVNVLLNAWLVPSRGIDGAAAATFATEACVTLGAVLALRGAGVGARALLLSWRWLCGPLGFALGIGLGTLLRFAIAAATDQG
jgi:O-antigen/teichoic acid export membrane protein